MLWNSQMQISVGLKCLYSWCIYKHGFPQWLSEELIAYCGQAGWVAPSVSVASLFYNIVAHFAITVRFIQW